MTAVAFDTHAYIKKLKEAGFTEPQAEAQAEALTAALGQFKSDMHLDELATKRDLKELELTLESRLADVRRDIEAMKAELLKWIIGLLLAQTGLIAALVKLL
jgi:hypothetical protein